jgi:antibiotic biosynthesis monooxygenase (ABM) superfamily enzyme
MPLIPDHGPWARQNVEGHGSRVAGHRAGQAHGENYQHMFNFEASEHLNAWLEPSSAIMTKMKPENHNIFLCIILKQKADEVMASSKPVIALE